MAVKPEPKISFPEGLIAGAFLFALPDAIDIILLFFGLDDFGVVDAVFWPATQLYLYLKGVRGTYALYANIAELVPYLGKLPLRTAGYAFTYYIDHHPEALEKFGMLGGAIQTKTVVGPKKVVGGTKNLSPQVPRREDGRKIVSSPPPEGGTRGRFGSAGDFPQAAEGGTGDPGRDRSPLNDPAFGLPPSAFEEMQRPLEEIPEAGDNGADRKEAA